MDRRDFVRLGAIAGALTVRGKPLSAEALTSHGVMAAPVTRRAYGVAPFELEEATLADLQAGMAAGRLTARSITQAYLDRIGALDRQGPTLRRDRDQSGRAFDC